MFTLNVPEGKVLKLLLGGLVVRLVLAWLPEKYLFYLVSDDAYYYFAIAKNLVSRGMLSADGITHTNGFHPLWLFVITPIFLFFKNLPWLAIHLVLTLSAIFDTLAAFLIYKVLETLGRERVGFWAAVFYLVNPYGLMHTMNGLETAQNNFFLAFLVFLSVQASVEWLKSNWFRLGAICGLALLSRTDNLFAVAALWSYLLWQSRDFASVLKAGAVSFVLVLPWLVYNQVVFGAVVQTSGTAYPYLHHQQFLNEHQTFFSFALVAFLARLTFQLFVENAMHYGNWVFTILLGLFLTYRLKNWPKKYRPVLWALAAAAVFIAFHILARWSVRPWYPQAVFVLTLPAVALALEKSGRYLLTVAAALALISAAWWMHGFRFRVADRSPIMLEIINRRIPLGDRVGVFNSGYLQYFTDRRVINLDGLVNNEVFPYYKRKEGAAYFRARNIRWLLDNQAYLGGMFGPYFGTAAESLLSMVDVVPNIVYYGNNVFLIEVSPDTLHPPPRGKVPFGRMLEAWKERTGRRKWGPIPYWDWFKEIVGGAGGTAP